MGSNKKICHINKTFLLVHMSYLFAKHWEEKSAPRSLRNVSKFIKMYRNLPCLWKVKSEDYSKNIIRQEAWGDLVQFKKSIKARIFLG